MKTKFAARREALFAGAHEALKRSALRARALAARTGTPLVISRNGRVERMRIRAAPGRREDFEKYLASVPDAAPPENDRLD